MQEEQYEGTVPTLRTRAAQTLVWLALEPEWEARFEPNSYGFRPGRSVHDAIEAVFAAIRTKPKFVLDADIAGCFDNISHEALVRKLATYPTLRRVINGWLKAGVRDGVEFKPTEAGAPQGGPLSPLLANVALHGLETHLRAAFKDKVRINGHWYQGWKPLVVVYADDFVVLHEDRQVIEQVRQPRAGMIPLPRHPGRCPRCVGLHLLERVSARLVETEAALAAFAYGSVAVGLAGVLLRRAGQAPAGVVHASHGELAAQVGSDRETVNTPCIGSEREGWSRLAAAASGRAIWPVSSDWWAAEVRQAQEAAEW